MNFLTMILTFSLVTCDELSIAVKEETHDQKSPNKNENFDHQLQEMVKYMQVSRKQEPSPFATMTKYINSYKINHEKYQSQEEKRSDKVLKQNNEKNSRTRRSVPEHKRPREVLKFELADARIPNADTVMAIRMHNERNSKFSLLNETKIEKLNQPKKDMSVQESVLVKITHPAPIAPPERRKKLMKDLPIGVKNAINLVLNKDKHKSSVSKLYPDMPKKRYAGTKYVFENGLSDLQYLQQKPGQYSEHPTPVPLVLYPQYVPNYSNVPNYDNIPYLPEYYQMLTQPEFDYNKNEELKSKYPNIFTSQVPRVINTISSKFYPGAGHSIIVAAEGKPNDERFKVIIQPSVRVRTKQVDKINFDVNNLPESVIPLDDLAVNERAVTASKERPQDSTAPILFPAGTTQPKHKQYSNDTPIYTTKIVHPDVNVISAKLPDPVRHDFTKFYKNVHLLSSNSYFNPPKDKIPIVEMPDETAAPQIVPIEDIPQSVEHLFPKKTVPVFPHEHKDLQYASGYAFGYRVRDFHTGNDYGHTQNRDPTGVTRGEYHILLPDGRIQSVRYKADEKGYHADVSYESKH